ncbi:MAG TPA: peptidylprolyl isomerase [Pseudomonadales bacterium]
MSLRALKGMLRSPLLHFAAAGALIFAAWSLTEPLRRDAQGYEAGGADEIVLTADDLKVMVAYFGSQWRRLPTRDELDELIERRITEEVLMREALRLGLDRGDEVIRRRLSQKLEMTLDEIAAVESPSEAELVAFYEANAERYAEPERVSFEQRFVSEERRGESTHAYALSLLERLRAGADAPGDPFHLPSTLSDVSAERLTRAFGPAFAAELLELAAAAAARAGGEWVGPVESPWGQHLVRVTAHRPIRRIPFDEARDSVLADWRDASAKAKVSDRLGEMRARYRVVLPPADDLAALTTP